MWDVLVATELIPTYKDSIFLTVDDAIAAANVPTPAPDEPTNDDKVWRSCCLFIKLKLPYDLPLWTSSIK